MRPAEQVFVGIPGPELDPESAGLLSAHQPGGVILFKRNIKDEEQLNDLVTSLRRLLPDAVFAIDAEGGRVDRLKDVVGPAPAAAFLARHAPSYALQAGHWVAQALRLFDIDVDFAPVVDLNRGASDNALDERYFGATPAEVIPRAQAFLRGLHSGGAGGCLKHFPGLGGAGEDTHYRMSAVFLPAEELRTDLEPFAALGRLAGAVMVGHALYPAYDSSMRPATLSPAVIGGVLRGRLGFDGVVFSDDMEMKALDEWGDLPERCEACFAAGCDVLLVCHTLAALPEVVARLEHPSLAERVAEANRRLDTYRQRLLTLRTAQDYIRFMRENSHGERLDRIRQALAQIQASGGASVSK
ncbi:MAG TPA: beta-N-acetylhexosaminidase [Thermoanaerobaculia bacterium]|jgi:beta-N-acetylhexosaminidase|nr:beta-N-acetylhexosaminidase [Thermoanaerobaculia bacterium]